MTSFFKKFILPSSFFITRFFITRFFTTRFFITWCGFLPFLFYSRLTVILSISAAIFAPIVIGPLTVRGFACFSLMYIYLRHPYHLDFRCLSLRILQQLQRKVVTIVVPPKNEHIQIQFPTPPPKCLFEWLFHRIAWCEGMSISKFNFQLHFWIAYSSDSCALFIELHVKSILCALFIELHVKSIL